MIEKSLPPRQGEITALAGRRAQIRAGRCPQNFYSIPMPSFPVVYLPGLDGTGRLLYRQPGLHERHLLRCISYPQDRACTYDDLAQLGIKALEELGRGVVLAESFGGAVGLTVALQRPDLVERLVLVNTFAWFPHRLLIRLGAWLSWLLPAKPSHPATRGLRGRFFFDPSIPQSERDAWWERTADVPMSAFGYRIRLIAGLDLRPRLSEIQIPTLILAAPNDRVVPVRAGRELARLLPRARLLELPVGHAAMIHPQVDVARWLEDEEMWR